MRTTTGTPGHEAASPGGARHARETTDRLLRAATRSGAHLIAEAALLVQGWAVLADPIAGAVYSTPAAAAADGVHAAADPYEHPHCLQRPAAGAVLVLAPGPPSRRSRQPASPRPPRPSWRCAGSGRRSCGASRCGCTPPSSGCCWPGTPPPSPTPLGGSRLTHVTVYRLTGADVPTAHQVLWRAVGPSLAPHADACTLLGRLDGELVVAELHRGGDDGRVLRLVSRVSERHHLLAGMAGPLPGGDAHRPQRRRGRPAQRHPRPPDRPRRRRRHLPARAPAADRPVRPLGGIRTAPADPGQPAPAPGVAPHRLQAPRRRRAQSVRRYGKGPDTRAVPAAPRRPGGRHRAGASAARPPRARLRRDPRGETGAAPGRLETLPDGILDTEAVRAWAHGLVGGLEPHLRIALACWLDHHARTAPAAAEPHVHRTTLSNWLTQCAEHLAQNLGDATVRSEVHLALRATRTGPDDPAALPRRGGRTYRRL